MSLALVVGIGNGGFGSVLCIGADNYIKVESACQPCCKTSDQVPAPGSTNEARVLEHAQHDDCFDCTDIELRQQILRQIPISNISLTDVQVFDAFCPATGVGRFVSSPQVLSSSGAFFYAGLACSSVWIGLASAVIRC